MSTEHAQMRPDSEEWRLAWARLERNYPGALDPSPPSGCEEWQYMGAFRPFGLRDLVHEFRSRMWRGRRRTAHILESGAWALQEPGHGEREFLCDECQVNNCPLCEGTLLHPTLGTIACVCPCEKS